MSDHMRPPPPPRRPVPQEYTGPRPLDPRPAAPAPDDSARRPTPLRGTRPQVQARPQAPSPGLRDTTVMRDRVTPSRTAREAARAQVLPFRRSPTARRVRRLRRHPLVRLLHPLAVAILLVGTPVAAVAWMLQAPQFALAEVRLSIDSPARRVPPDFVQGQLTPFNGRNLWRLDLEQASAAVAAHPWVADVGLRKQPPATLVVHVVERREVALYRDPAGLWYVDEEGRVVAPLDSADQDVDLPLVSGGPPVRSAGEVPQTAPAAIGLLAEIRRVDPPWAAGLSEVEILSERDFRIHTLDLPFPLLVRAGTVSERSRYLDQLLPFLDRFGDLDQVDLRFARRIIVEPTEPSNLSPLSPDPFSPDGRAIDRDRSTTDPAVARPGARAGGHLEAT